MAPASFSTLPLELKARIVEMTSDQEDAYKERVTEYEDLTGSDEMPGSEGQRHIDCLSALALVNKELRELAAKHQFKSLSSHRARLPIFRFHILPRYGHHIVEISFSEENGMEGSDVAFTVLEQLLALRTLSFEHKTAERLFGPGVTLRIDHEDEAANYRAQKLSGIASRIEGLVLDTFAPAEGVALVLLFSNVKTLCCLNLKDADQDIDHRRLAEAIFRMEHLRSLTIDFAEESRRGWPTETLASVGRDPPPLKFLQLLWFPFDRSTLGLIRAFGETVETLTLSLRWPMRDEPSPDLGPLQLPRLARLNLNHEDALLTKVLPHFPPSPNLSHFSLAFFNNDVDPNHPALLSFLTSQPALHTLSLNEFNRSSPFKNSASTPYPPPSLVAYEELIRTRALDPSVLDRPHFTPFHPDATLDYTEEERPFLMGALRRTLAFGLVELDRIEADGSVARAVGWVETLKPLEHERLTWKD